MAKRRGWAGTPPADDDEARERIVQAAVRCLDRGGPSQFSLSEVATELGVIRQTVYRYFPSTSDLLIAVSSLEVMRYIDEIDEKLRGITDPAEWVVDCLAAGIEILPRHPHLTLLLEVGETERFTRTFTSEGAITISRELFKRSAVDWPARGFEEEDLHEIEELMLRLLLSFVVSPSVPARSGKALRSYLRRWLAPAVATATATAR